jgi:hypothetical protein
MTHSGVRECQPARSHQAYSDQVPSKTLLILTLIGAAVTIIIGVLLFFGLA